MSYSYSHILAILLWDTIKMLQVSASKLPTNTNWDFWQRKPQMRPRYTTGNIRLYSCFYQEISNILEGIKVNPFPIIVLIFYCCIANHHKSAALQVRTPGNLLWALCLGSHKAGAKALDGQALICWRRIHLQAHLGCWLNSVPVMVGLQFPFPWLAVEASLRSWMPSALLLMWPPPS